MTRNENAPPSTLVGRIGRTSVLTGAALTLALWAMFATRALADAGAGGAVVTVIMSLLAVLTAVAAALHAPRLALGAASLSLFPVGVYLLLTPTIYAGIGLANGVCIVGALAMILGRRRAAER